MADIINLRQVRRAKTRADKARVADANRFKFGRTAAERIADLQSNGRRDELLAGALRESRPARSDDDQQ